MSIVEYKKLDHTAEQIDEAINTQATHCANSDCHITAAERTTWNGKADKSDVDDVADDLDSHTVDVACHITSSERIAWNGKVDKITGKGLSTNDYTDTDKNAVSTISSKVDKVSGKGLSTNDYTTTEKTKLSGIATNANNYTHPTYTSRSSGLYKVTVDSSGHVSGATTVAKSDITALGIPAQDTTYSTATTSASGLMSSSDKTKLNGIATGATANTGTITGIKMNGASKGTSGVVDLGIVVTDVSGKADTSGTYENLTSGKSKGVLVDNTQTASTIDSFLDDYAVKVTKIANYAVAGFSGNDGLIISIPWSSSYGMQIAVDDNGYNIAARYKNDSSGWSSWKKLAYKDDIPNFQLDGTTLRITTT